jgi:hypothetical protein
MMLDPAVDPIEGSAVEWQILLGRSIVVPPGSSPAG